MPENKTEKAVVVTTSHRGVFFGYMEKDQGEVVTIKNARNCVYWSKSVRGFMGLAKTGPDKDCRIGPAVNSLTLRGVTSIAECAPDAIKAWEAQPWS